MFRIAVLAAAVLVGLGARPARADMIFYNLTTYNVSGFTGPFAEVTVNLTSPTTAKITFDSLQNGGYTYLFHSQGAAGINTNGAATISNITATNAFSVLGFSTPVASDGGSGTEDGFGNFSNTITLDDGFQHSASEISFTLTKSSGTWSSAADVTAINNKGHILVAQIGPWDGIFADGFAPTGYADSAVQTNNGPPPLIGTAPVPPSGILLGMGAIALLWTLRRQNILKPV
jgi:hypothetical protein